MQPFSQPIEEIIKKRFSCRNYLPQTIPGQKVDKLNEILADCSRGPLGSPLRFQLVSVSENDSAKPRKLGTYGFIKGAESFIAGAVKATDTHLHQDHIGGLKYFPNARCFVSASEFQAAFRFDALLNGYMPKTWPSWFKPELLKFENHPFGPFTKSIRFGKDIILVPTPGHSRGHISVIVRPASGEDSGLNYFCAGDSVFSQELFYQGHPSGITTNLKQAKKSLQRIQKFTRLHPTVLLPTHDPDAGRRLKKQQIVDFNKENAYLQARTP